MKKGLILILCFLILTSCGKQDVAPERTDNVTPPSSASDVSAPESAPTQETTVQKNPKIYEPEPPPVQDKNTSEPTVQTVCIEVLGPEGILLYSAEAEHREGLTAFDLLMETAKEKNIPAVYTGGKSSPYITSIGGFAEKGHGPSSGWIYTVNGESVMKPSNKCAMSPGDRLEWKYITQFTTE